MAWATVGPASNIGYRYRLGLASNGPNDGFYWLSVPYLYTPPDSNGNTLVDVEDLVQDLQPDGLPSPCTPLNADCAIARALVWDRSANMYRIWTGLKGSAFFEIEPGNAYAIEVREVDGQPAHTFHLVGAHDPSYEHDDCYDAGAANLRWISLPPHLDIDTSFGAPDVLDAEDLGQALGGPEKVLMIRRLDESTGLYDSWVVGAAYGIPFALNLSRAYAIDLTCSDRTAACAQCPWSWTPPHR